MAAKPRSATAVGSAGTTEWARTNRRSETAATGSRSSSGPVSGAMRRVASRCSPRPTRTWQKSASVPRRSHIRAVPASVHSNAGSGCTHSSDARCSPLVSVDLPPHLVEVPEVVLAVFVHLGGLRSTASAVREHADHRDDHHDREDHRHRTPGHAGGEHQRHHADHGRHHHERQQSHQEISRSRPRNIAAALADSARRSVCAAPPGALCARIARYSTFATPGTPHPNRPPDGRPPRSGKGSAPAGHSRVSVRRPEDGCTRDTGPAMSYGLRRPGRRGTSRGEPHAASGDPKQTGVHLL